MLIDRVEQLSEIGVDIQTMTILFRSEGYSDTVIAEAYDAIAINENFSMTIERGLPSFHRV